MSAPVVDLPSRWRGPILPVNTESGDGRVYTLDDGVDVDVRPLRLVADAFLLGRRHEVEPFHD